MKEGRKKKMTRTEGYQGRRDIKEGRKEGRKVGR
jgi:hypothetical protein